MTVAYMMQYKIHIVPEMTCGTLNLTHDTTFTVFCCF